MSDLRFQSCLLVSHKERRARRIVFHPRATVLKGPNDTGKSSIVKSLYQALGADPAEQHPRWKGASVCSLLTFTLDGETFHAYRKASTYAIFRGADLLGVYRSVTNELGPKLAELLEFQLKLPDRNGQMVVPPPAYAFLPFYCDQDKGWTDTWVSFAKLSQFKDWRREVVHYHTGIKSSGYYKAMEKRAIAQAKRVEPNAERSALSQMLSRQVETQSDIDSEIDPEVFKREIEVLVEKHNALSQGRESYRRKLIDLNAKRVQLVAQKEILEKVRTELHADYTFSVESIPEDTVQCPTCGQVHENSFSERFAIAQDEAKTADLMGQVSNDLVTTIEAIDKERASYRDISTQVDQVQEILAHKHKNVTFKEIVRREGEKEYLARVAHRIQELDAAIGALDRTIEDANAQMAAADSPKRKAAIIDTYRALMASYLKQLQVESLSEVDYKQIDFKIHETGSDRPRAVLAYMFSILNLIRDAQNTPDCPIVLDSPNQQDQDPENHALMLKFIRDQRPPRSQLVLCLVDDCAMDFGGSVINLTQKDFVLSQDEYSEHARTLAPFENVVYA